jgi:hypothetical protein
MKKILTIVGLLSISYTVSAFADYNSEIKPNPLKCMGYNKANDSQIISLKVQYTEVQGKLGSKIEYQIFSSDGLVANLPVTIVNAPPLRAENEGITNLMLNFKNDQHKIILGVGGNIYEDFLKSKDETKEYNTKGSLRLDDKRFWFDSCIVRFASSGQ